MNKKLLLIGLVFLLLISSAFAGASDADNAISWYSWDDDLTDLSGSGYDFFLFGDAERSTVQSKLGTHSLQLDGTGDWATTGSAYFTITGDTMTSCAWLYKTDTATGNIVKQTEGSTYAWDLLVLNTNTYQPSAYDGSNNPYVSGTGGSLNTWVHYCLTFDSTTLYAYVDGVLMASTSDLGVGLASTDELSIGVAGANYMAGYVDEVAIYDEYKDITGINAIKDLAENPFTPAPAPSGDYFLPLVSEASQIAPITINSLTYVPVVTGTIEILNLTNISMTGTGYVEGKTGQGSEANCELEFDSVTIGNTTTSPNQNRHKSLFISTGLVEKSPGNYSFSYNCKKDTNAGFDILNAKALITQYVNADGVLLNVVRETELVSLNSTNYTLLGNFTFTTLNDTVPADGLRYVVFESSTNNQYDSDGTTCLKASAFGLNSSEYCRYGETGGFGSGSAFALLANVTNETTFTIDIYGKSTTSDGSADLGVTMYEVISHESEMNNTPLVGLGVTSSVLTTVASLNIENSDHVSTSSMVKAGFSIESLSGVADMVFRLTLSGDSVENGSEIWRDVEASNQEGLVTIQELFSGLGVGNYTINLQASSSNSNSNITGGELLVVSSNNEPFTPNIFEVTAEDISNSSSLFNFNVTDSSGSIFTDAGTGTASIPSTTNPDNITIVKDTYYNKTYFNHDTLLDLLATLYQTNINITVIDSLSGSSVESFNVSFGGDIYPSVDGVAVINWSVGIVNTSVTFTTGYDNYYFGNYDYSLPGPYSLVANVSKNITLNILDEITGLEFNLSGIESGFFSVYCDAERHDVPFTNSSSALNFTISTCPWDFMSLTLNYPDSSYFRTLIPDYSEVEVDFYMVDVENYVLYQILLKLTDLTGQFNEGFVTISKVIDVGNKNMVQQLFDVQSQTNLYLLKDAFYTLGINDGEGNSRNIGYFQADSAGTKEVTIPAVTFVPPGGILGNTIYWDFSGNSSAIRLMYYDNNAISSSSVNFSVYNSSRALVYSSQLTSVSSATFTYNGDINKSYRACLAADSVNLDSPVATCKTYLPNVNFMGYNESGVPPSWSEDEQEDIYNFIVIVILILILGLVGAIHPPSALGLAAIIITVCLNIGMFVIKSTGVTYTIAALCAVGAVLSYFVEENRK